MKKRNGNLVVWVVSSGVMVLMALTVAVVVNVSLTGCGASLDKLPISDEQKTELAIQAGCATAASAGCFEKEGVQRLLGKLKTSDQCVAAVKKHVEAKQVTVNITKLTNRAMTCNKFIDSILD